MGYNYLIKVLALVSIIPELFVEWSVPPFYKRGIRVVQVSELDGKALFGVKIDPDVV